MTVTLVTVWVLAVGSLWLALLTLPRWFVRSMHRHRIWRHRDQVVDEILSKELPRHPAVWELLRDTERSIEMAHRMSFISSISAGVSIRRMSPRAQKVWEEMCADAPTNDLEPEVLRRIEDHRERVEMLSAGLILLGSWVGVVATVGMIPAAIWSTRHEQMSGSRIALATDDAVGNTRLGELARRAVPLNLRLDEDCIATV
jgi:hypothetical protein